MAVSRTPITIQRAISGFVTFKNPGTYGAIINRATVTISPSTTAVRLANA